MDGRLKRGDKTSREIFVAAKRAFARYGFAGATVRAIGADAEINPALLRYHFGSKGDLYAMVVDTVMTELRDKLLASVVGATDPADMIRRALDAYLEYIDEEREFPRIVQRSMLDDDGLATKHVKKHLAPMLSDAKGALRILNGNGKKRLVDFAMTLLGASLAPHVYAPLIETLTGQSPLTDIAKQRRKEHLESMVTFMLSEI